MDIGVLLASWLHTLGFVIVMGYYGVLGRMLLPALDRALEPAAAARAIGALADRARPFLVLSVALFVLTGTYLLVASDAYAGLGNVLASTWTVLMLVKHVVIAVLVVLAILADRAARSVASTFGPEAARAARRRLGLLAEAATACGALAILLTVAAQLQA